MKYSHVERNECWLEKKSKKVWKKYYRQNLRCALVKWTQRKYLFKTNWHSATKSDTAQDITIYTYTYTYIYIYIYYYICIYTFILPLGTLKIIYITAGCNTHSYYRYVQKGAPSGIFWKLYIVPSGIFEWFHNNPKIDLSPFANFTVCGHVNCMSCFLANPYWKLLDHAKWNYT